MEFTREEIEAKIAEIRVLEKTAKPFERDQLFVRRQVWTSRLVNAKQGRPVIVSEASHTELAKEVTGKFKMAVIDPAEVSAPEVIKPAPEEVIGVKPKPVSTKPNKGGKHGN